MFGTIARRGVLGMRVARQATRPILRSMTNEANAASKVSEAMSSANELKRAGEFARFVDDRVALRLERFATKEELFKMKESLERRIEQSAEKLEGQFVKRMEQGFEHMKTKLKYFFVVGIGSVLVSFAMLAARAGLLSSEYLGKRTPRLWRVMLQRQWCYPRQSWGAKEFERGIPVAF